MLMQQEPVDFSSRSYLGHLFWLMVHPGLPQLNLPRSGLLTLWNVPGMGPNLTPRLFPSTLLRSQKSGEPVLDRVSSTSVEGDWPVIPLHSIPKLLRGAPQSPVSHTNLPSLNWHPVLAQNLMATVLAFTFRTSQELGPIYQPVLLMRGTPKAPIHIFWGHWFLNTKRRKSLYLRLAWGWDSVYQVEPRASVLSSSRASSSLNIRLPQQIINRLQISNIRSSKQQHNPLRQPRMQKPASISQTFKQKQYLIPIPAQIQQSGRLLGGIYMQFNETECLTLYNSRSLYFLEIVDGRVQKYPSFAIPNIVSVVSVIKGYLVVVTAESKIWLLEVKKTGQARVEGEEMQEKKLTVLSILKELPFTSFSIREVTMNMIEFTLINSAEERRIVYIYQLTSNQKIGGMGFTADKNWKILSQSRKQLYASKSFFDNTKHQIVKLKNFSDTFFTCKKIYDEYLHIMPLCKTEQFMGLNKNYELFNAENPAERRNIQDCLQGYQLKDSVAHLSYLLLQSSNGKVGVFNVEQKFRVRLLMEESQDYRWQIGFNARLVGIRNDNACVKITKELVKKVQKIGSLTDIAENIVPKKPNNEMVSLDMQNAVEKDAKAKQAKKDKVKKSQEFPKKVEQAPEVSKQTTTIKPKKIISRKDLSNKNTTDKPQESKPEQNKIQQPESMEQKKEEKTIQQDKAVQEAAPAEVNPSQKAPELDEQPAIKAEQTGQPLSETVEPSINKQLERALPSKQPQQPKAVSPFAKKTPSADLPEGTAKSMLIPNIPLSKFLSMAGSKESKKVLETSPIVEIIEKNREQNPFATKIEEDKKQLINEQAKEIFRKQAQAPIDQPPIPIQVQSQQASPISIVTQADEQVKSQQEQVLPSEVQQKQENTSPEQIQPPTPTQQQEQIIKQVAEQIVRQQIEPLIERECCLSFSEAKDAFEGFTGQISSLEAKVSHISQDFSIMSTKLIDDLANSFIKSNEKVLQITHQGCVPKLKSSFETSVNNYFAKQLTPKCSNYFQGLFKQTKNLYDSTLKFYSDKKKQTITSLQNHFQEQEHLVNQIRLIHADMLVCVENTAREGEEMHASMLKEWDKVAKDFEARVEDKGKKIEEKVRLGERGRVVDVLTEIKEGLAAMRAEKVQRKNLLEVNEAKEAKEAKASKKSAKTKVQNEEAVAKKEKKKKKEYQEDNPRKTSKRRPMEYSYYY